MVKAMWVQLCYEIVSGPAALDMTAKSLVALKGVKKKTKIQFSWDGKDQGGGSVFTTLPSFLT